MIIHQIKIKSIAQKNVLEEQSIYGRMKMTFDKREHFICGAVIPDHGIKTMSDKGVRVMIDTMELNPIQLADLFSFKGKSGWFIFTKSPEKATEIEIPEWKEEFKGEKSPSQRLRAVVYRLWEQSGKTTDFEVFYRSKMELIIEKFKEKIEG